MVGSILVAALLAQTPPAPTPTRPASPSTPQVTDTQPWSPPGVFRIGRGVVSPEVLTEAKPKYTKEAMKARIQGTAEVMAIILADGTVGEVRIARSLDKEFGLDEEAIAAVKRWTFRPGKKDGVAVPVLVSVELTFTLRGGKGGHLP